MTTLSSRNSLSGLRTKLKVPGPYTVAVSDKYPMKETEIVAPFLTTNVHFPSKSVDVPFVVPSSVTKAPTAGLLFSSRTVPEIFTVLSCCACILACKVEISLAEYATSEEASKHTARAFPLIDLLKRITIIIKGLYYIPHSVLGSGPMTNLIVPPFIMSSCDIQQLP